MAGQDAVCDVTGCENGAERSLSGKKVEKSDLSLKESTGRQVHLCKEHYREYKKFTKVDRKLETMGR